MTNEDAINTLNEMWERLFAEMRGWIFEDLKKEGKLDTFKEAHNMAIKSLEQEPKTGHWINAKVGKLFPSNDFKCSKCGNILDFDGVNCGRGDANFCPNCGVKMESEGKE